MTTNSIISYVFLEKLAQYFEQPIDLPAFVQTANVPELQTLMERAERWALGGQTTGFDKRNPTRLYSIFGHLSTKNETGEYNPGVFRQMPILPLSLQEDTVFPLKDDDGIDVTEGMKNLEAAFLKDYTVLKGLAKNGETVFTDTLYYVMKKYASCLPAGQDSTSQLINLFETLKVKAALTQCLYWVQQETGTSKQLPFVLMCADQSGIQDFIYNIASSKAAKSLKGRSFYLQMVMESIVQKLVRHPAIKASLAHVLYSSGGKMYVILPNLEKVKAALQEIEAEVRADIFEQHKTRLTINFDTVEFGYKEETDKVKILFRRGTKIIKHRHPSKLWGELANKIAQKKYQPFQQELVKNTTWFNEFFEANDTDGFDTEDAASQRAICQVTGDVIVDLDEKKNNLNERDDEKEPVYVTKFVKDQANLGYGLKDAIYFNTDKADKRKSEKAAAYTSHSTSLQVVHDVRNEKRFNEEYFGIGFLPSLDKAVLKRLNNTDFLNDDLFNQAKDASHGFSWYGGNRQAAHRNKDGNLLYRNGRLIEKEFDELAGASKETEGEYTGFKRLGVLRMDVDNLGQLFRDGLNRLPALAAYATVSAQMDLFFGGYLNTIREMPKYRDYVNILYAGGDDVFAVGRWDLLIDFAEQVRNDFRRFVVDREDISLSAGIALVGGKFPIAKAAKMAGDAEKAAKKYKNTKGQIEKNAFAFYRDMSDKYDAGNRHETISWAHQEYEFVKTVAKKVDEWLKDDKTGISKGLIYKLYQFKAMKEKGAPDWKWLSGYYFQRLEKKDKRSKQIFKQLKNFFFMGQMELDNQSFNFPVERGVDLICIGARIAELNIRSNENKGRSRE